MGNSKNKRLKTEAMHFNGLDSDLVTLRVGPEQKILSAHKDLLTQIPFFNAILGQNDRGAQFQEAKDGCITMPDDDAQAFADLLRYLYSGHSLQLPVSNPATLPAEDLRQLRSLVNVYMLANKLGAEKIENSAMDAVAKWCRDRCADPASIATLRTRELSESKLYQFMIEQLAFDLRKATNNNAKWHSYTHAIHDYEDGLASFSGQDCLRLTRLQCSELQKALGSPSKRQKTDPCDWHVHLYTKTCPSKKKT